ncbi:MAG: ABC transporter ATP-binding protein [Alphaproteobacteria bacterium]|nr:ABC transporter ATP-binding protein [Alphaproteobacteria bacterium]
MLAHRPAAAQPAAAASVRQRIEVRDITKVFPLHGEDLVAVEKVSFSIREGEFVALLGPSGCGKSTILNMIAGLITITGGAAYLDGRSVAYGKVDPQVGYVFQRDTVFPWRTVRRNIGYGLELSRLAKAEREARVLEVIRQAGLKGFEDAYPLALSGGMRQRVALMRTLIMQPQILLMDEPFGALDTHTKLEMHKFLLEIWEHERQTVLFVTHDLSEALTLSDRIILLSARPGRLKEDFEVPFPRPRDAIRLRESREYSELFAKVWHSLGDEFAKTKAE